MKKNKISMSNNNLTWLPTEEMIPKIAQAGFEAMDLKMTYRNIVYRPEEFLEEMDRYARLAAECGLEIGQAHGPYSSWLDKESDQENVHKAQMLALQGAERIGVPYLVVHPCVYTWCMGEQGRKEAAEKNLEWLSRYIPFLQKSRVKMCIENCYIDDVENGRVMSTFGCDPEEMVWLIDALNEKAGKTVFGVCMDTGHCHCSGGDVVAMAERLGKRILALHLHENDRNDDYHLPPFTISGGVPWREFMQTLDRIGYEGTLNFELDGLVLRKSPEMTDTGMKLIYDIGTHLRQLSEAGE